MTYERNIQMSGIWLERVQQQDYELNIELHAPVAMFVRDEVIPKADRSLVFKKSSSI